MAMNLGNLNNFIESYRGSADRARKIADENAQKAASAIAFQPIDMALPPAAPAGARNAPPSNPMAALAAMGGPGGSPPAPGGATAPPPVSGPIGAPAAPGGGGLPPQAMALLSKLIPPGGQGAPGGAPPPMPGGMRPMAQPPASPVPPPGQGNVPQPGPMAASQSSGDTAADPMKQATEWITSTFKGLKQQNPQASPYVLALAVQKRIEAMKGLAPETRAAVQAQAALLTTQARLQAAVLRYQETHDHDQLLRDLGEGKEAGYEARTAEMGQAASESAGARRYAADKGVESAGVRADATRDAASIRADAAKAVKGMAPGGRRDQAIIDGVAKITAAAAMTGADPSDDIKAFKREVASTGTGGSAAPQRYKRSGGAPPADHVAWLKAHNTKQNQDSFAAQYGKAALAAALK